MGSINLVKCKCCDEWFCIECSNADKYYEYCSKQCEKEDSIRSDYVIERNN
jgi:hypothetical protein